MKLNNASKRGHLWYHFIQEEDIVSEYWLIPYDGDANCWIRFVTVRNYSGNNGWKELYELGHVPE